jgi:hypothetical protein
MTSGTHPASPEFAFRPTARFRRRALSRHHRLGLVSEVLLRGPVLAGGADGLSLASALPLRQSLVADTLMVMADLGVAVLLYRLLKPYGKSLALAALLFRTAQAMVISANLLFQVRAVQLLEAGAPAPEVIGVLGVQAIGYDLGSPFSE